MNEWNFYRIGPCRLSHKNCYKANEIYFHVSGAQPNIMYLEYVCMNCECIFVCARVYLSWLWHSISLIPFWIICNVWNVCKVETLIQGKREREKYRNRIEWYIIYIACKILRFLYCYLPSTLLLFKADENYHHYIELISQIIVFWDSNELIQLNWSKFEADGVFQMTTNFNHSQFVGTWLGRKGDVDTREKKDLGGTSYLNLGLNRSSGILENNALDF